MIVLSNKAAQTIQPGAAALLDEVVFKSGCAEYRNSGNGPVKIRCGAYDFQFNGNISGAAGTQANLAIAVDGVVLPETTMVVTTAAETDVYNVHGGTKFCNRCGGSVVSVVNTGTTPVTIAANPALIVKREA